MSSLESKISLSSDVNVVDHRLAKTKSECLEIENFLAEYSYVNRMNLISNNSWHDYDLRKL